MDGTTDDVIDLELLKEEISKYNEASGDSIENEAAAMALTYDRAGDEEFPAKTITLLDKYLQSVSKSGNPMLPWPKINKFIRNKIDVILTSFYMKYGVEDIDSVNVMPFNYSTTKEKLFEHFETFTGAPFTIQRLCEIIIDPRRHYKKTDKLFRALEKNILVVSTVGRLSSDCSEPHQRSSMFNEMQVTYTPFRGSMGMEEEMKDDQMKGEPMEEDGDFSDEIKRESMDSEKESEDVDMSDVHLQRVTPDEKSPDSSPVVSAASSDTSSPGTSTDSKAPDSAPAVSTGSPDSSAALSDGNGSLLKRKPESDNEEEVDESGEDGTERRKRPRLDKEAEAKELEEEHKVLESSSASKDAIVEDKQEAPCDEKDESVEMPKESTNDANDVDSMEHSSSEVSNSENGVKDPEESVQSEAPVDSTDKEESSESVEASPSGDLNGEAKSSEAESTDEVKAPTEEEPSSEKDTEGSAVEKEVQKSKEEAEDASSSGGTDCSESKEPEAS